MPITKDSITQNLNKHLTLAEQEQIKTDANLQANMQHIIRRFLDDEEKGGARRLIGRRFYFIELLRLFPEAYKRHRHSEVFMESFKGYVKK